MPKHIGIIMDGNGRWATQKGLLRTAGHKEGLKAAKRITAAAVKAGVQFLSLYVFSTENWKRAATEVSFLMGLIQKHLKKEFQFYTENSIRVIHSGDLKSMPPAIQKDILQVVETTKQFNKLTVNLAINYGGQNEILRAFQKMQSQGVLVDPARPEVFESFLDNDLPPLDLVIRTAGEKRISNFLLWQSAYSEFYFSDKLWPDWDEDDLKTALHDYHLRTRKFGGVVDE